MSSSTYSNKIMVLHHIHSYPRYFPDFPSYKSMESMVIPSSHPVKVGSWRRISPSGAKPRLFFGRNIPQILSGEQLYLHSFTYIHIYMCVYIYIYGPVSRVIPPPHHQGQIHRHMHTVHICAYTYYIRMHTHTHMCVCIYNLHIHIGTVTISGTTRRWAIYIYIYTYIYIWDGPPSADTCIKA